MPNENTSYLKLPLPHPDNLLEGDVFRIRDAFIALDVDSGNQDQKLSQHAQFLENLDALKADKDALPLPSDAMDSTSSTTAASSKAVKTAHDRAVAAQAAANNAQSTANTAVQKADAAQSTAANAGVAASAAQGTANAAIQKADAAQATANAAVVPRGIICLWSGAANAVPAGWALCNGGNTTPDLRDRFVVAAGGKYAVGAKGGAEAQNVSVSLNGSVGATTLSVAQMPSHEHSCVGNVHSLAITYYDWQGRSVDAGSKTGSAGSSGSHTHSLSGSASGTVSTLPSYYALAYIMKL